MIIKESFCLFLHKTFVVGAHENRLANTILMSIHNIRFYVELTKISLNYHEISSADVCLCCSHM